MSLILEMRGEVEGRILAEVGRRGITPQQMLDIILHRGIDTLAPDYAADDTTERREWAARSARYRQWAAEQPRAGILLSDEAISREAIYRRDDEAGSDT